MPEHRWKFNQSEQDASTGLYETDFRPYDPQTGRFTGMDALAELMPDATPFHFGFSNPISFNDPTGLAPSMVDFLQAMFRASPDGTSYSGDEVRKAYNAYYNAGKYGAEIGYGDGALWVDFAVNSVIRANESGLHSAEATSRQSVHIETGGNLSEVGFSEGFIPVWGSARTAHHYFELGEIGGGLAHSFWAAADVFGIVSAARAVGKGFVSGTARGVAQRGRGIKPRSLIPISKAEALTIKGGSSRKLATNLEAAGYVRAPNTAAHHIVAESASGAAASRRLLQNAGIGIDDAANGIFLPSSQHARIHTNLYHRTVFARLSAVSVSQIRAELRTIAHEISNNQFPH